MKNTFLLAIMLIALCGCGHSHTEETVHEHVHLHNFTAYSDCNEFFMQHEGLEAGTTSCITLFVTTLDNFKPTTVNEAAATLKIGEHTQNATAVAGNTGIFNFNIVPEVAGEGTLSFNVAGDNAHFHIKVDAAGEVHSHDSHSHSHSHGEGHAHHHEAEGLCGGQTHDSHADSNHSHAHSHDGHSHTGHGEPTEGKDGDVAFSKEQSWNIDFGTSVVEESHFDGAVKIAAKVSATPANFTTIVATASGKVQFAGNIVEGSSVAVNDILFYLEGSDVTDNDAAVKFAEAESNYQLAKADYERKKFLFSEKVVPEREYQSAEAAYRQAEARFTSMKRSFGNGKITLRAAKEGYVASLLVANGDYVEPGTPIARIQSKGSVNVTAELPVRFASQLQDIEDVNIVLPTGETVSMNAAGGSIVAVGRSVNRCNMLPLTISMETLDGALPGSIVTLYIVSRSKENAVVVPKTALVEEMGNFFVFVQNNPISFEKRAVEIGSTDGVRVKIVKGLHVGERVVTKGAVSLKLSQGAAALDPHAGHVH